ncbi:hypothetical protein LCGC14_1352530 [marine sediment metagenome]|uniref:Uncharacterized protein n=1 Tax=marine sediment metagenome TaxID=412755 RepID=A0A0F9KWM1_9ZZZZ
MLTIAIVIAILGGYAIIGTGLLVGFLAACGFSYYAVTAWIL